MRVRYLLPSVSAEADLPRSKFGLRSHAFFCRTCGDVWGRVIADPEDWWVTSAPCERHLGESVIDLTRIPGSILPLLTPSIYDEALNLKNLPLSVLLREFSIHLKHKGIES